MPEQTHIDGMANEDPEGGLFFGVIVPPNARVSCAYHSGVGLHLYFRFRSAKDALEGAEYLLRQAKIARDAVRRGEA